ncbi:hypothetical protein GCM10011571_21570 [Marinithermofilum abyssi]|uniref:ChrR-like cupin domain-containing protein n=1 Tax=Marinithermofilum abyssi TaxID=1571185 RepID=A0A8J2VCZ2_9BACL|nr:cupin domain-containing protein [Marinithermofilum abyssi]GGE19333.1 hypothetical protein GCM10011571_21570 [Marinithermofilum abyssi]
MEGSYVLRNGEHNWIPMSNGVRFSYLRKNRGEFSVLLKMEAEGRLPIHEHIGGEEFFVVEGDVELDGHSLHQGDYFYAPPGVNPVVQTRYGCTLLITSARGVESAAGKERVEATTT